MALFTLSEIPLFGRAARENQLEILSRQRDELSELYVTQAFDVQKIQRAHHAFSQFVGQHISVAFDADPGRRYSPIKSTS